GDLGASMHLADDEVAPGAIEPRWLEDPAEHRIDERAHEPVWLERLEIERRDTRVGVMGELSARGPHFRRLRIALVQIHHRLSVGREARIRVQPRVSDHDGTTER